MRPLSSLAVMALTPAALLIAVLAGSAEAGPSASGTATATVVTQTEVRQLKPLRFGYVKSGHYPGTVTVTVWDHRFTTGGADTKRGEPYGPAKFKVSGQPWATYEVGFPSSVVAEREGGHKHKRRNWWGSSWHGGSWGGHGSLDELPVIQLKSFTTNVNGFFGYGRLDDDGRDYVLVGGTLLVPPQAKDGVYTAEFEITISY